MLWRCALVTLGCDPLLFARPLHTLAEKAPSLQIEYDASLTGLGIILSELSDTGEAQLICAVKLPIPFDLGADSGYQNSAEFMAIVVGLSCLASLGYSGRGVKLIGDNTSSLMGLDRTSPGGPQPPCCHLFYGLGRNTRLDHCLHRTRCRSSKHSVRLTLS